MLAPHLLHESERLTVVQSLFHQRYTAIAHEVPVFLLSLTWKMNPVVGWYFFLSLLHHRLELAEALHYQATHQLTEALRKLLPSNYDLH